MMMGGGMGGMMRSMMGNGGQMGFGGMMSQMSQSMRMMGAGGRGAGMGGMMGQMGMGANPATQRKGQDIRNVDKKKERSETEKKIEESKGPSLFDPYYDIVEVKVYGQARFFTPPPEDAATEPSLGDTPAATNTPATPGATGDAQDKSAAAKPAVEAKPAAPTSEPDASKKSADTPAKEGAPAKTEAPAPADAAAKPAPAPAPAADAKPSAPADAAAKPDGKGAVPKG